MSDDERMEVDEGAPEAEEAGGSKARGPRAGVSLQAAERQLPGPADLSR
jgi:hypothetical protein